MRQYTHCFGCGAHAPPAPKNRLCPTPRGLRGWALFPAHESFARWLSEHSRPLALCARRTGPLRRVSGRRKVMCERTHFPISGLCARAFSSFRIRFSWDTGRVPRVSARREPCFRLCAKRSLSSTPFSSMLPLHARNSARQSRPRQNISRKGNKMNRKGRTKLLRALIAPAAVIALALGAWVAAEPKSDGERTTVAVGVFALIFCWFLRKR